MSLDFFIDIKSFRSHYGPGVDSACNRNEYQENFLGVKAGWIILGWISRRWDVGIWTGLGGPRIEIGGGCL